jgi:hypothetical protein
MKKINFVLPILVVVAIVFLIDGFTNRLDIENHSWDFKHYIALAEHGFNAKPLLGPFAYRYPTPFLAAGIGYMFGTPMESSFKIVAYLGAVLQLLGVFYLVKWFTNCQKGSYTAMLITALSFCNVKFLFFDVFRPDHLAFAFIILESYFAFKRRFVPLLITSIIGVQFREFAVVPLLAYLLSSLLAKKNETIYKEMIIAGLGLFVAVIIPRMIIPVTGNKQYITFSIYGIKRFLTLPLNFCRDANLVYLIAAYFLPTIILVNSDRARSVLTELTREVKIYLTSYIFFVAILIFYGGTDMIRFVAYLFLPQVIVVGFAACKLSKIQILVMILGVAIFNRTWASIPIWDFDKYLDFYGGYHSRLNLATICRYVELAVIAGVGNYLLNKLNLQQDAAIQAGDSATN